LKHINLPSGETEAGIGLELAAYQVKAETLVLGGHKSTTGLAGLTPVRLGYGL
jgi:hypothetical protein